MFMFIYVSLVGNIRRQLKQVQKLQHVEDSQPYVQCLIRPVPDSVEHMDRLQQLIQDNAQVRVLPYASITVRQAGKEHVDFDALAKQGAFAFTDDGVGVQESAMMYEAMQQAAKVNKAVVAHCEDNSLIYGGAMHQGKRSEELGIPGIPNICEAVQIARDVLLAEAANCHYHVCHVSTKECQSYS